MITTFKQKQAFFKEPGDVAMIVLASILVIFLGKMILDYIDMPDKPVCSNLPTKHFSGKFNPYYVECKTK